MSGLGLTEIDDVTRAPGRVVPGGDVQRVQAAEEGVIRAVFVEEGAIVEAGDPLVELDGLVQTSQPAQLPWNAHLCLPRDCRCAVYETF